MPQRPDSHVVADIAVARVMQICNACGWACEVVHKDYGDDLLVQTSLNGIVDHNRLWIQVKGTRDLKKFYSKKNGYSLKVSPDQALKWIRSADLAVVVIWDVEKDFGLWSILKYQINQWDWYLRESENARIVFDEESVFCQEQAVRLGWIARREHHESLLRNAMIQDLEYERNKDTYPEGYEHKSLVPLVAFDFLKLINVLDDEYLDKTYLAYYESALERFKSERENLIDSEDIEVLAAGLAMMGRLNDAIHQVGISASMIGVCSEIALEFIRGLDDVLDKAES
ncbi:DUF4365 domain-containing protein [Oculatella sp. FACHB-28]|uniref:DUF4365 domain-containing protein n=1 Tax=Oculatella sp. FACHB-28 TaxID=2692845 RepID=UPI001682F0F0|nr:DUF4365 domain-containing protein [Oculatella sp. FACHB-28]MBD2058838.1 DUF4365 domain-containing protein [Oculatella sp. FACHB-28]